MADADEGVGMNVASVPRVQDHEFYKTMQFVSNSGSAHIPRAPGRPSPPAKGSGTIYSSQLPKTMFKSHQSLKREGSAKSKAPSTNSTVALKKASVAKKKKGSMASRPTASSTLVSKAPPRPPQANHTLRKSQQIPRVPNTATVTAKSNR